MKVSTRHVSTSNKPVVRSTWRDVNIKDENAIIMMQLESGGIVSWRSV